MLIGKELIFKLFLKTLGRILSYLITAFLGAVVALFIFNLQSKHEESLLAAHSGLGYLYIHGGEGASNTTSDSSSLEGLIYHRWVPESQIPQKKYIDLLNKVLLRDPKNQYIYWFRGLIYMHGADYDKAIVDFKRAIYIDPFFIKAHFSLGNAYALFGFYEVKFEKKRAYFKKALFQYNKIIALLPRYSEAINNRGNVYLLMRRYRKAIEDYSSGISIKKRYSAALNNRGNAYLKLGLAFAAKKKLYRFHFYCIAALKDYCEAIKIEHNTLYHGNRALLYLLLKQFQDALKDLNVVVKMDSENPIPLLYRHMVYRINKKNKKAMADINTVIKKYPKNFIAYLLRSTMYLQMNKIQLSLIDANKAVNINPKTPIGYIFRARIKSLLKDRFGALADLTEAIKLDDSYFLAFAVRSDIWRKARRFRRSIRDIDQAIKIFKKNFKKRLKINLNLGYSGIYSRLLKTDLRQIEFGVSPDTIQDSTIIGRLYYGKARIFKLWRNSRKQYGALQENIYINYKYILNSILAFSYCNTNIGIVGNYISMITIFNMDRLAINFINTMTRNGMKKGKFHFLKGKLYLMTKQYKLSLNNFEECVRMKYRTIESYTNIAKVYYKLNYIDLAIKNALKAITLDTQRHFPYYLLALCHAKKGQFYLSIRYCDKVLLLRPNYASAYFAKALSYLMLGKYKKAEIQFQKGLKISDAHSMVYNIFAVIYLRKLVYAKSFWISINKMDYAIVGLQYINKAIEKNSMNVNALRNLAYLYYKFGLYAHAIREWKKAVRIDPNELKIYYYRSIAYEKLGLYKKAVRDLLYLIKRGNKHGKLYYEIGRNYFNCGHYKLSIKYLNKAVSVGYRTMMTYIVRGQAYLMTGQCKLSIINFENAIKVAPECYYSYYWRGSYYQEMGNNKMAIKDYKKALELNSECISCYYNRGMIYMAIGKTKKAIRDFNMAIKLQPEHLDAYRARRNAYLKMGLKDEANGDFIIIRKILEKWKRQKLLRQ